MRIEKRGLGKICVIAYTMQDADKTFSCLGIIPSSSSLLSDVEHVYDIIEIMLLPH
jgi:hypothetical protein